MRTNSTFRPTDLFKAFAGLIFSQVNGFFESHYYFSRSGSDFLIHDSIAAVKDVCGLDSSTTFLILLIKSSGNRMFICFLFILIVYYTCICILLKNILVWERDNRPASDHKKSIPHTLLNSVFYHLISKDCSTFSSYFTVSTSLGRSCSIILNIRPLQRHNCP